MSEVIIGLLVAILIAVLGSAARSYGRHRELLRYLQKIDAEQSHYHTSSDLYVPPTCKFRTGAPGSTPPDPTVPRKKLLEAQTIADRVESRAG
jgi:hypothetical protein